MPQPCCPPSRPVREPKLVFDAQALAALCKALAHPARVQLLHHLAQHGTCYFGNLSAVIGLAPSTTSQHVTMLKEAGLIDGLAEEQRTCYCVNPERLAVLKRLLDTV